MIVELDYFVTIGRIGEHKPEHLGGGLSLLQPVCRRFVRSFRLDNSQRKIACVAQQKIRAHRRLAYKTLAHRHDASVSNRALLGNRMRIIIPAHSL